MAAVGVLALSGLYNISQSIEGSQQEHGVTRTSTGLTVEYPRGHIYFLSLILRSLWIRCSKTTELNSWPFNLSE